MEIGIHSLIKFNHKIFRYTQIHLDKILKPYDLTSGAISYLFILEHREGISQNQISKEVDNDKSMSARTINKLIDLSYIHRETDATDSRAYKLYLTEKAREVIPKIHKEIAHLVDQITNTLTEEEKDITINALAKIYESTKELKE